MIIEQKHWTQEKGWMYLGTPSLVEEPQFVLVFGARALLEDPIHLAEIKSMYSFARILLCSTAGEILDTKAFDATMVLTAIYFEKTKLQFAEANMINPDESEATGKSLADALPKEDLRHVMVFTDGLHVNGTSLVRGINNALPKDVAVTGGLVGDGSDFKKTVIGLDTFAQECKVVAVGFYGQSLKVGYGSLGGWDSFGVERIITKSEGNVLYELDGKPALDVYEEYLGEHAKGLPGTGLRFPLRLRVQGENGEVELVRGCLGVDRVARSLSFGGDVPQGVPATLMKANFDRLVDGAAGAGKMSQEALGESVPDLAILISCIGRKLVLKERIAEELDAVRKVLGETTAITGFYAYGELCPGTATDKQCQLHNQTMTITTFTES